MMKNLICVILMTVISFTLTINSSYAAVKNISSGGAMYSTLTNAVQAATSGDTLLVSTGVYYEAVDIDSLDLVIDGKYNDDFSAKMPDGRTIISEPPLVIIYHGSVFDIINSKVTLINIEITKGASSIILDYGGGLDIRNGSEVAIYSCSVYSNSILGQGAGIYVYNSTLLMTNSLVFGNRVYHGNFSPLIGENGSGGGIYAYGSTLNLLNNTKVYNNMAMGKGGGIFCQSMNISHIQNCSISGNTATNGGGIGGPVSVYDSDIHHNIAFFNGGGVLCEYGKLSGCLLTSNSAGNAGGGVHCEGGEIFNCVIVSNYAAGGGGAYINNEGDVRNCLVTGNTAHSGGGIACVSGGTVENSTICNNSVDNRGGGLYFLSGGTGVNNIVYFNKSTSLGTNYYNGGIGMYYYNCCTWPEISGAPNGVENITNNPEFLNITAGNYQLDIDISPCVNTGTNLPWTLAPGAKDLEGNPRVNDGIVDMGAYESIPEPFLIINCYLLFIIYYRRKFILRCKS